MLSDLLGFWGIGMDLAPRKTDVRIFKSNVIQEKKKLEEK